MLADLQADLQRRSDPAKKAWWEGYVKGARFRGTPMGDVRAAVGSTVAAHPELDPVEWRRVAFELLRQPLSEDRLAGILLLSEHLLDHLGRPDLTDFRSLFAEEHLGDWGTCDWFCVKVLGRLLERAPDREAIADGLVGWTASEALWVRRAGLVAFVTLAPEGEAGLPGLPDRVITGAGRNVTDSRRFAQTSVGWTLRELSRAEPERVRAFVAQHGDRMSAEARRAASARLRKPA